MPEKTVKVPNISCGHCVATIERDIGKLQGVESVHADLSTREVTVRWTEAGIGWDAIAVHLADIGYPAEEAAPVGGSRG